MRTAQRPTGAKRDALNERHIRSANFWSPAKFLLISPLKYRNRPPDNPTNGDEQSEPGSDVKRPMFRAGHSARASSEADERRAQAGGTLVSTNRLAVTFNAVDLTGGPRGRPV